MNKPRGGRTSRDKSSHDTEHITSPNGNVFADIGFDESEAANLKIRAELMISLEKLVEKRKLKQKDAAVLFGISRPAVSDLVNGKVAKFSIDKLVTMLERSGKSVKIQVA